MQGTTDLSELGLPIQVLTFFISMTHKKNNNNNKTIWPLRHSINISVCKVWEIKVEVQVLKKEPNTHIYLDNSRVQFLSIKRLKKNFF